MNDFKREDGSARVVDDPVERAETISQSKKKRKTGNLEQNHKILKPVIHDLLNTNNFSLRKQINSLPYIELFMDKYEKIDLFPRDLTDIDAPNLDIIKYIWFCAFKPRYFSHRN